MEAAKKEVENILSFFLFIITITMHSFRHQFLKIEIQSFEEYINFIEENFEKFYSEIKSNFKKLEDISENDPLRISENDEESNFDYMFGVVADKHFQHDLFQQRYRSSVIIQLYIFFETELTNIVNDKNEKWEKRQTFLENANRILKEKIDISTLEQFIFLKDFAELRNFIVHNNALISDLNNTKRINSIKKLNKMEGFELKIESYAPNKVYSIKAIEKEFLLYSLKQIESLLDRIYTEVLKSTTNNI